MTDYQICPELKIPTLHRCSFCSYATSLYCKKYNKSFVGSVSEGPAEINEIKRYFADTSLSVEIDPKQKHQILDIAMQNSGDEFSIDVHVEQGLDEKKLWYEAQAQELEVETPEAVEYDSYLIIDMGEVGDGMIIDDSLL